MGGQVGGGVRVDVNEELYPLNHIQAVIRVFFYKLLQQNGPKYSLDRLKSLLLLLMKSIYWVTLIST